MIYRLLIIAHLKCSVFSQVIFGWLNASSNLLKISVFDWRLDPLVLAVLKKQTNKQKKNNKKKKSIQATAKWWWIQFTLTTVHMFVYDRLNSLQLFLLSSSSSSICSFKNGFGSIKTCSAVGVEPPLSILQCEGEVSLSLSLCLSLMHVHKPIEIWLKQRTVGRNRKVLYLLQRGSAHTLLIFSTCL